MSASGEGADRPLAAELRAVAEAAGARLRAEVAGDREQEAAASQELLAAATSAISARYSLMEIAQAEARGKDQVRRELGGDALKRVERTGLLAGEAEAEHHRAIARAMRLGLSMREIGLAAGVTHGTIRAIANRLAENGVFPYLAIDQGNDAGGEAAPKGDNPDHTAAIGVERSSKT